MSSLIRVGARALRRAQMALQELQRRRLGALAAGGRLPLQGCLILGRYFNGDNYAAASTREGLSNYIV